MINFNSSQQVSALFFGGKTKLEERVPIKNELGVIQKYKSGKRAGEIKYRNETKEVQIKGFGLKPLDEWKQEKSDYYKVDESVLELLSKKKHVAGKVATLLLKRRELVKQIDTYYEGIKKLTYGIDSCIHPQFNLCATETGRTSAKLPNPQNIPSKRESKVKQIFTSRFNKKCNNCLGNYTDYYGDGYPCDCCINGYESRGQIIEFDWSAIEIMAWAVLTKDSALLNLISSGINLHKYLAAKTLDCKIEDVSDDIRQQLKPGNFNLIYGGTDWNLTQAYGLDPDLAKKAYDAFWSTFPEARVWCDNLMHELDRNAKLIDNEGNMVSSYTGITGRRFHFKNYPKKVSNFCTENRIYTARGFKFSEGMNYKVQSLATADIHLIAIGKLWRECIKHRDKFLMINTVHDSVMFDCRKEYIEECCNLVKPVLESVVDDMKKIFNININVPLKVEYKIGESWYDC